MTDWRHLPDLEPGRALFLASDGSLHSVPLRFLRNARAIDPHLTVLATSPEGWRTFVAKQVEIERRCANRNTVTEADEAMLAAMGIAPWNDPSLENLLLAVLPSPKP